MNTYPDFVGEVGSSPNGSPTKYSFVVVIADPPFVVPSQSIYNAGSHDAYNVVL